MGSHLFCHHKSTYRHTAAKCLGTCHDIRLNAISLPCIILTASSHTALDLVKDHQNVPFLAQRLYLLHKLFCGRINAALSLYRFKQDRTGLICHLIQNTLKII